MTLTTARHRRRLDGLKPLRRAARAKETSMKLARTTGLADAASLPRFLPHPFVGLRHYGNNRNTSRRPAHFAWPTHPKAAISGARSYSVFSDDASRYRM